MGRLPGATWFAALLGFSMIVPAVAKEFYVGEPVVKNDMQLVPHYLLGIEMAPMVKGMDMGPKAVHLEIDVHATKDDKHGFKEDESFHTSPFPTRSRKWAPTSKRRAICFQ